MTNSITFGTTVLQGQPGPVGLTGPQGQPGPIGLTNTEYRKNLIIKKIKKLKKYGR